MYYREQADFIRKLLQVIEQNLEEEELGSTLIADRMAMSPRQFYRKFKEISPIAPSDLIKNYRMEKAARLLREEDLSIQDVIADVGISSRSYFYKEFARKFGRHLRIIENSIRIRSFLVLYIVRSLYTIYCNTL